MTTRKFTLFAAAFWLLFGLVAGIQVWISMVAHNHHIPLLLAYHIAVWIVWTAPTVLILSLARRFPVVPMRAPGIFVHLIAATVIGVMHTLYSLVLMLWLRPYEEMTESASDVHIPQLLLAQLQLEWILYLLVLGAVLALEYSGRYRERANEAAELKRSLTDSRLHALELQIQPHFLFNTLNSISGLVRVDRKHEAIGMVAGLADLLRYSLDHAGRQRVTLGEEIDMLTRYLQIQSSRFPDRMSFEIKMHENLRQATVPILILQPLAENAVRYGVAMAGEPSCIAVRAVRVNDRLELEVRNRGRIVTPLVEGIGLRNTRERLRTMYGDDACFSLADSGDEVVALLDLPLCLQP